MCILMRQRSRPFALRGVIDADAWGFLLRRFFSRLAVTPEREEKKKKKKEIRLPIKRSVYMPLG